MTTAAGAAVPRPPGAVDGRGYELVSQADKNDAQVQRGIIVSSDASRVLYDALAGVPGATSGQPKLLAQRTSSGWVTRSAMPPRDEMLGNHYLELFATPDLSAYVAAAYDGIGGVGKGTDESLVKLSDAGDQTLLHYFPRFEGWSTTAMGILGTDDLRHLYGVAYQQIDPSHPASYGEVYDFASTPPTLVSTMPGTGLAAQCGIPNGSNPGFAGPNNIVTQNWISTDGSRVFFMTKGDTCTDKLNLYVHDTQTGVSTLISGPPVGADVDRGVKFFLSASPDGSHVYYETGTSLDPADDVDGSTSDQDVYRWDASTGTNTCLTCMVGRATVNSQSGHAAVSENGEYVYFDSTKQLLPEATAGAHNVYVVHDGVLRFVGLGTGSISTSPSMGSEITPDGKVLVFASNRPEMNALTSSDNGGFTQYYRYDAVTEAVTCISCPSGGAPATANAMNILVFANQLVRPDQKAMTDDGSTIFFGTPVTLVPQDVNGDWDVYEWHNGTVSLISSGTTSYPPGQYPYVYTTTADGRDLFIGDTARLTPDAQDDALKIYDVRVGGGFEPVTPPAGCSGDACHGQPSASPWLADPATAGFGGAGNARPPAAFSLRRITHAQRARLARTGRLVVRLHVNRPGRVAVVAQATIGHKVRRIAHAVARAKHAGTIRLRLALSRTARRQLARAGRLNVVLGASYSKVRTGKRVVLRLRTATTHRHGH